MLAAKGKSCPDGTYLYKCGKCKGNNPNCDWCFAGNFNKVRAALKEGRRGQTYYSLLKEFLRIAGKPMVAMANDLKSLKAADIGYISLHFGLNFKATWEWLEECHVIKYPYSRVGFKVGEAYLVDEAGNNWPTVKKLIALTLARKQYFVEWEPFDRKIRGLQQHE